MAKNYLHECLKQFHEVSKQLWGKGKPFDLKALEKEVEVLQSGEVGVREIQNRFKQFKSAEHTEHWWFNRYWVLPSLDDLSQEQQKKTFSFHQVSRENEGRPNEEKVIRDLLEIFRHIELVSIVLRFIRPDSFGILSPPVEHVLALSRGKDHVETYQNYLNDLRKIRDHYALATAAEADKALWVLEHKCFVEEMKDERIKQEFEKDEFMLQLRAKNLVTPLRDLSSARLATALRKVNNHLAGLVGSYALEENVKKWARHEGVEETAKSLAKSGGRDSKRLTASDYINALVKEHKISSTDHKKWRDLVDIRNQVFHAYQKKPDGNEVKQLVDTVLKLEQRLETLRERSRGLN